MAAGHEHDDDGAAGEPERGSLADHLLRIAWLRDSGALTAAEYEKAKAKLLGG